MTNPIDSRKLVAYLQGEIRMSTEVQKKAWKEFLVHKEMTSNLASFVCNARVLMDDLVKVAEEGEKIKMSKGIIAAIESGTFDVGGDKP